MHLNFVKPESCIAKFQSSNRHQSRACKQLIQPKPCAFLDLQPKVVYPTSFNPYIRNKKTLKNPKATFSNRLIKTVCLPQAPVIFDTERAWASVWRWLQVPMGPKTRLMIQANMFQGIFLN